MEVQKSVPLTVGEKWAYFKLGKHLDHFITCPGCAENGSINAFH